MTLQDGVSTCAWCLRRLHRAVTRLPLLYVHLHRALAPGTPHRRLEHAANSLPWAYRGKPSPLRLALLAHAEHCVATASDWARSTAPDLIPGHQVRPGYLLQTICVAFAANLPGYILSPADGRHAHDLSTAYTRALRLLGHDEPSRPLPTPCPSCDLRSLVIDTDGLVTCRSCPGTWPASHVHSREQSRH
ncbi:hypothetical protein [Streptomyces sp. CBMA152]|uniref:hypothetical protein n=1 Tax=Streptomyces sp. CBMA152 TaxID=1896312 RepID=UPI0016604DB1|nr:hypothetical protein [Streptomyces sp. CBMA152]